MIFNKNKYKQKSPEIMAFVFLILFILLTLSILKLLKTQQLVWGDFPNVSVSNYKNFIKDSIYPWSSSNFGGNIRNGLGGLVTVILVPFSFHSDILFKNILIFLPFYIAGFSVFVIAYKLFNKNYFLSFIIAFLYLANPVVFGDFLNGQTFWPYATLPWVFFFLLRFFTGKNIVLKM